MPKIQDLIREMIRFYAGDPARIQHFLKVHSFARLIGQCAGLDAETLLTLEAAAVVHDIGIKPAEQKYGSAAGSLQEQEGPPLAEELLTQLGFDAARTARVAYLVGHHRTYSSIDGADYQILVEADFLVNHFEGNSSPAAIGATLHTIFRTQTGKDICREMFAL